MLFPIAYQECFSGGYRNGVKGLCQISDIEYLLPRISDFKVLSSPEPKFVNAYLELGINRFYFFISIFIIGLLFLQNKKMNFFV